VAYISEIISHTFSKVPVLIYYHQIEMKQLSEYHSSLYLIFQSVQIDKQRGLFSRLELCSYLCLLVISLLLVLQTETRQPVTFCKVL